MILKVTSLLTSATCEIILPSDQIDSLLNLSEQEAKNDKIIECFGVKLDLFYFKLIRKSAFFQSAKFKNLSIKYPVS